MAIYVLVHGAWHGGWCWTRVKTLLQLAGHTVYAPSLTGCAEHLAQLTPDVDLNTHVQDVVTVLEAENLHDVILVGHGYGGMVITGVVDQASEQVAHVVYLDAGVPRDGESLADLIPVLTRHVCQNARDHWLIDPPRGRSLFGVSREPDISRLRARLTPQPVRTFVQPLHLRNPAIVSAKPRTAIYCSGGEILFSFLRHLIARRTLLPKEAGWRLRTLSTGHDAMLLQPKALADLLLEGAAEREVRERDQEARKTA